MLPVSHQPETLPRCQGGVDLKGLRPVFLTAVNHNPVFISI